MTKSSCRLILVAALIMFVSDSTLGRPNSSSFSPNSRLNVHIPRYLWKENGFDHVVGLFGLPSYGGSIAQHVYYADSTLCESDVDTSIGYPAREIDPKTKKMKPWPSPYILMVDRSDNDCTFVQKVRNAQTSGAAGVIISDNMCLCSDDECRKTSNLPTCESRIPIMADNGSGSDVTIPSMLMYKRDADAIKEVLISNRPVLVEMTLELPEPDDIVTYDLYTTPVDKFSSDYLKSFKTIAVAFGEKAYFTPRMYIYDGTRSHCQGENNKGNNSLCYNLCTNNGRYCAIPPDDGLEMQITGADVVVESVRRLCIWRKYGATSGIGPEWWDYVNEFEKRCGEGGYFTNENCIKDAFIHSKIDFEEVNRCMFDSGGGWEADLPNVILESELLSQERHGVVMIPTVFVNGIPIRGALTVGNVFTAICSRFSESNTPTICTKCIHCPDVVGCVEKGKCSSFDNSCNTTCCSGDNDEYPFTYLPYPFVWLLSYFLVLAFGITRMLDLVKASH